MESSDGCCGGRKESMMFKALAGGGGSREALASRESGQVFPGEMAFLCSALRDGKTVNMICLAEGDGFP